MEDILFIDQYIHVDGRDVTRNKSNMAIRSVDEIINLSDSSKHPEKLAFKDLVKHIDPRIRERAPRHTSLHFKIPGILWGQPVFQASKVEKMILRHYKSIGFKCVRLGNREILIKWGNDDDSQSRAAPRDSDDASTHSDVSETCSDDDGDSDGDSDDDGDGDRDSDRDRDRDSDRDSGSDRDRDSGSDSETCSDDSDTENKNKRRGNADSESDATDTDEDDDGAGQTKCVTVEQIPLSKRLSIINNQMMQNM